MLLSLKWLSKYVDISGYTATQLADKISSCGLEVDEIKYLAKGDNLIVGQIKEINSHPNSNHLHLLKVDIGQETLDIVCGAQNVRKDAKVIVAQVGAYLEAIDLKIKSGIIRGETSNGMCCSLVEIGVDPKTLTQEQLDGIELLDDSAKVGDTKPLEFLGLNDVILDIGLTPNRGDCMSMWGIALDIGAILGRKAILEEVKEEKGEKSSLKIDIETNLCEVFSLRKIQGITVKQSPLWLRQRLIANNIKPINNIVDLGNYVMLLTGQPLHMYDADKISSNHFVVKDNLNTNVLMLDEKEYQVKHGDIVICNQDRVECIAGVMGAHSSMVDETTKNIIIEAASFNASSVRKTARRLNLQSESSNRFVKETDKYNTKKALDFTVNILREISSISKVEQVIQADNLKKDIKTIKLPYHSVEKLLGFEITKKEIETIFSNLYFDFKLKDDIYYVNVPTRRNDISIKEDLIEEILRIYGFDELPSSLPFNSTNKGFYSETQQKRRSIREYLINNGIYETLTYNLCGKNDVEMFNYILENEKLSISNPLTEDRMYLRKSIVPSLLKTISYNNTKDNKNIAIFETSKVYAKEEEKELLCLAISGEFKSTSHLATSKVDYFTVKGFLEGILEMLFIDKNRLNIEKNTDMKQMHPYRSAKIYIDKNYVGYLGQVHPLITDQEDIETTYIIELDLTKLLEIKGAKIKFSKLNIYPSTSRDIAFIVKKDLQAQNIIKLISKQDKKLIKDVEIFDVYEGQHVEEGFKSIAVSLTYQDDSKTLLDEEVNLLHKKVISVLIKEFDAKIR